MKILADTDNSLYLNIKIYLYKYMLADKSISKFFVTF